MSRPTLRTAFCDRVGIEYPVVLAGMGPVAGTGAPVATGELAAAVSNAGGLGIIGGVAYSPEVLRAEIRKIRSLTKKPFGVDLLLSPNFLVPRRSGGGGGAPRASQLPKQHVDAIARIAESLGIELKQAPPEAGDSGDWVKPGESWAGSQIEVLLEEEVPVFASGLGTPKPFADALHANGTTILSLVGTVKAARQVAADGAEIAREKRRRRRAIGAGRFIRKTRHKPSPDAILAPRATTRRKTAISDARRQLRD